MSHIFFKRFLSSLSRPNNETLLESIQNGYNILFEGLTPEEKYEQFWKDDISPEDFQKILNIDPSRKKSFLDWLIQLVKDKKLKEEDFYKATKYLKTFMVYRQQLPREQQKISDFSSLPDLFIAVKPFMNEDTESTDQDKELVLIQKGDAENVYEDNEWKVIVPKTLEASRYFGRGTEWCTLNTNQFKHYSEQDDLYINHNKTNGNRYQFHFPSFEYMNEENRPIQLNSIGMSLGLKEYYLNNGYVDALESFNENETIKIAEKYPDMVKTGLNETPNYIHLFPEKERVQIITKFMKPLVVNNALLFVTKVFPWLVESDKVRVIETFEDQFKEEFENHANIITSIIPSNAGEDYISKRISLMKAFKDNFKKYFIEYGPSKIFSILRGIETGDELTNVVTSLPEIFVPAFENHPEDISQFHTDNRMRIIDTMSDAFRKVIREGNLEILFYIPNQMKYFRKFKDEFVKGMWDKYDYYHKSRVQIKENTEKYINAVLFMINDEDRTEVLNAVLNP